MGVQTSHFSTIVSPWTHLRVDMVKYTANFKHTVLLEYCPGIRGHSFRDLAHRFKVRGGHKAILGWHRQWKGTPSSLERKKGSGRRALLTPKQVERLITKPIRRCNQNHVAVEYHELREAVEHEIGHSVSVRTLQRYGKERTDIHCESTIPRTEKECTLTFNGFLARTVPSHRTAHSPKCLSISTYFQCPRTCAVPLPT